MKTRCRILFILTVLIVSVSAAIYISAAAEGGMKMNKYKCVACGYIYDDAVEEVKFEDLPDTWVCPLCGVPKSAFVKVEE